MAHKRGPFDQWAILTDFAVGHADILRSPGSASLSKMQEAVDLSAAPLPLGTYLSERHKQQHGQHGRHGSIEDHFLFATTATHLGFPGTRLRICSCGVAQSDIRSPVRERPHSDSASHSGVHHRCLTATIRVFNDWTTLRRVVARSPSRGECSVLTSHYETMLSRRRKLCSCKAHAISKEACQDNDANAGIFAMGVPPRMGM